MVELPDMNIGNESGGITSVIDMWGTPFRIDVVLFRRENVAAVLFVMYFDGETPLVSIQEAAEIFDQRIIEVYGY
jgi:hypothetical protein